MVTQCATSGEPLPGQDGGVGGAGEARNLAGTRPYITAGLTGEKRWGLYHAGRGDPGQVLQQEEVVKVENSGRPLRLRTRPRAARAWLRSVRAITRRIPAARGLGLPQVRTTGPAVTALPSFENVK